MGTTVLMVAMPLYILDIGGSAATIGLLSFTAFLPAMLIYPFAGVLGDRCNRKTIMILTKLGSGIVLLALTALAYWGFLNLPFLLSGLIAVSVLNGLFDPATKGILPQLVDADNLSQANSVASSLRMLSSLAGPVVGVTLYVSFGMTILFAINAICFLLSSCTDMLILYRHKKPEGQTKFFTELTDGFKFILNRTEIRNLCFFLLVLFAMVQPLFSVTLPLLFRTTLDYTDTQYGYLQMIIVAGAFLGSVLVGVLFGKGNKEARALTIGLVLLMVSMFGFSALIFPYSIARFVSSSLVYFALLGGSLGLLSAAIMFINVPVHTIIQKQSPSEYMSRVFSVVAMIAKGGLPFGALIYGFVLDRFAIHEVISVSSMLMLLISIVFWASFFGKRKFIENGQLPSVTRQLKK